MKRFVSIWFPHLLTDWFELRMPGLIRIPFVLVKPDHGRMIITHGNSLAAKKGIHAGMVLADAKAILPALEKFDEPLHLEHRLLKKIAEWCIRFTPIAAVDPLGGILLDASGCPHLWGSDEAYVDDITRKLQAKGYVAKAAIADTIGCAWAVARFGITHIVENKKQSEAIHFLPPESLRLDEATIECLDKLGLKQVSDFFSMPRVALRRRFGPLILKRIDQATGAEEEFIQPLFPPEPFHERLPCLEPVSHIEGIEIALRQLLQQLCERLQKEGMGLRTAFFKGLRTDNKMTGIQVSTSRPSANVEHLFHLFQMKLSTFEPALGIELFLLEATKVEEHAAAQGEIWKENGMDNLEVAELIDRLSLRIGADAIRRYLPDEHYWPERSFKKATSFTEQTASAWKLERPRPVRLLSPPELIEVMAPVPDYPPMMFKYRGRLHRIIRADGPERIEQEWWIQQGEHRDYYAVEDEEGCRYWLFRSGHYNEEKKPHWFIHGFFA
jgi:protein ImuB